MTTFHYTDTEDRYVTLLPKHRAQLQSALEDEMFNRTQNLKFHNILVFQRFYQQSIDQLKRGTISCSMLNWCFQQLVHYGAVGKKSEDVKELKLWMPCAIQLPHTYEHFPKTVIEYRKPPKKDFDDEIGQFLFQCQCFSEFFDLDFSFIHTEYVTKRKVLKMYQWMLMSRMFGDETMRKSIAKRLEQPLSVIPKMPKPVHIHLQQMTNVVLEESYSALEVVSKVKRHQMAVMTLALATIDKRMWYDEKNNLVFNPFTEEQRDRARELFSMTVENDFQMERSLRGEVNHFLKDLGFKSRILYWV